MPAGMIPPAQSADVAGMQRVSAADALAAWIAAGRAWVAADGDNGGDAIVGFVVVDLLDGNAHVEEISVLPEAGGPGRGPAPLRAGGAPAPTCRGTVRGTSAAASWQWRPARSVPSWRRGCGTRPSTASILPSACACAVRPDNLRGVRPGGGADDPIGWAVDAPVGRAGPGSRGGGVQRRRRGRR